MRRFIVRVSLFTVILLGILAYIEYNLSYVVNSYNKQRTHLERQLDSIEILVLGDSHASIGINPDSFVRKGFNLSNVGQDFYYDAQLMYKYLDRLKKLKTVIISVSDFSFWYRLSDSPENFRVSLYNWFWDIPPESPKFDWGQHSKILLYSPRASLQYTLQGFHVDLVPNRTASGWEPPTSEGYWRFVTNEMGENRSALRRSQVHKHNFEPNLATLTALVKNLDKRKIQMVFVIPPTHQTYYTYSNKEWHDETAVVITRLANQYHSKWFDYFKDDRFVTEDFYDPDHLNRLGAQKFSEILDRDIIDSLFSDRDPRPGATDR